MSIYQKGEIVAVKKNASFIRDKITYYLVTPSLQDIYIIDGYKYPPIEDVIALRDRYGNTYGVNVVYLKKLPNKRKKEVELFLKELAAYSL